MANPTGPQGGRRRSPGRHESRESCQAVGTAERPRASSTVGRRFRIERRTRRWGRTLVPEGETRLQFVDGTVVAGNPSMGDGSSVVPYVVPGTIRPLPYVGSYDGWHGCSQESAHEAPLFHQQLLPLLRHPLTATTVRTVIAATIANLFMAILFVWATRIDRRNFWVWKLYIMRRDVQMKRWIFSFIRISFAQRAVPHICHTPVTGWQNPDAGQLAADDTGRFAVGLCHIFAARLA